MKGKSILLIWKKWLRATRFGGGFVRIGKKVSIKVSVERGKNDEKKSFLFYWQALSCFRGRCPLLL